MKRGWLATLKGGITLIKKVMKDAYVPAEVAEARSEVCIRCPHNVFPDKGPFVKWADNLAEHATDGRRVSHHDEIGNCDLCTCVLRAKVWFEGPFKISEKDRPKYEAVNCWQLKDAKLEEPE